MSAGEHPEWYARLNGVATFGPLPYTSVDVANSRATKGAEEMSAMIGSPSDPIAKIKAERQKVYGDPRENHKGIAQMWACLLQPHADSIAKMEPLPEHTVAMMMAALKLNRMRRVFHQDNYDDLTAYLSFAREWQRDHDSKESRVG